MSLFSRLSAETEEFCRENGLLSLFDGGVAVALSGGADSIFLLHFMRSLSQRKHFALCAFHVNHGLRAHESDGDEEFCRSLCRELNVDFFSARVQVSDYKEQFGGTLEEVARRERYCAFDEFLDNHSEYAYLLTAHTASDNLETVLFRLARGTGLRGLCGIPSRRDRFLRPLLCLNGEEIRRALNEQKMTFVYDSSNGNIAYRRNYIRNQVVPPFLAIHEDAEKNLTRVCRNLSVDQDYLTKESVAFLEQHANNGRVARKEFTCLHEAIFIRVAGELYRRAGGVSGCEGIHLQNAYALLGSDKTNGRIDFPDELSFVVNAQEAFFEKKKVIDENKQVFFEKTEISFGEHFYLPYGFGIALKKEKDDAYFEELKRKYAHVFFADLSASYDGGRLYLRERKDGDSYRYGGMTHKIKKLFSDRKLSPSERKRRLLLCDGLGILWVPGFSPREPREKKTSTIYAYFFMNGGNDE